MSEMLGNQYFLVRRYKEAQSTFEQVLAANPANKTARKKLIICYVHNGENKKALEIFLELIREDIDFIIQTDVIEDDCPCPELIERFEKLNNMNSSSTDLLEAYGMLWLYCDMQKSLTCFQRLHELNPSEEIYSYILNIYHSYTLTHN